MNALDAPDSVVRREVRLRKPAKIPTDAQQPLAAKARIEGVRHLIKSATEDIFATSSVMEDVIYRIGAHGCSG